MGIDLVISQKENSSRKFSPCFACRAHWKRWTLLEERVLAVGIKVHMDSPLVLQNLKTFSIRRCCRKCG